MKMGQIDKVRFDVDRQVVEGKAFARHGEFKPPQNFLTVSIK